MTAGPYGVYTTGPSFIQSGLSALGGAYNVVWATTPQTITSNTSVPKNIALEVLSSGLTTISTGMTETIVGPISAGAYQLFAGDGVVAFTNNRTMGTYKLAWWGPNNDYSGSAIADWERAAAQMPDYSSLVAPGAAKYQVGIAGVTTGILIDNKKSVRFSADCPPNGSNITSIDINLANTVLRWMGDAHGDYVVKLNRCHTTIFENFTIASGTADRGLLIDAQSGSVSTANTIRGVTIYPAVTNASYRALSIGENPAPAANREFMILENLRLYGANTGKALSLAEGGEANCHGHVIRDTAFQSSGWGVYCAAGSFTTEGMISLTNNTLDFHIEGTVLPTVVRSTSSEQGHGYAYLKDLVNAPITLEYGRVSGTSYSAGEAYVTFDGLTRIATLRQNKWEGSVGGTYFYELTPTDSNLILYLEKNFYEGSATPFHGYDPSLHHVTLLNDAAIPAYVNGFYTDGHLAGRLTFVQGEGAVLTSGATITPTHSVHHVSGTSTISTITVPGSFTDPGGSVLGGVVWLIADGAWNTDTGGNISVVTGAVTAGRAYPFVYTPSTSKWNPQV